MASSTGQGRLTGSIKKEESLHKEPQTYSVRVLIIPIVSVMSLLPIPTLHRNQFNNGQS